MTDRPTRRVRRVLTSARTRAILSLGIVLGVGSVGTMAYWTDDASVVTGGFVSGKLDLKVDGSEGKPTAYTAASLAAQNLAPGESIAAAFSVQNAGSIGFRVTATGTAAGDLAPNLRFAVRTGATPATTGTQAANNRVGTCSGGDAQLASTALTGQSVFSAPPVVGAGSSTSVCVVVTLDPGTPTTQAQKTGSATFNLVATQVAP